MEEGIEGVALLLMAVTVFVSYRGWKDPAFFERHAFEVSPILTGKEYGRLISAGFLHANWLHLIFNLATLYTFSHGLGYALDVKNFLLLYLVSLLAGNLLALYIHRNHGDYRAIGASGAVSGVIFASVVMFPDSSISFPFLPIEIKSWLFGTIYLLLSLYAIKVQAGNIGHEAHVGGAIAGVVVSIGLEPHILTLHPWVVVGLLLPFLLFMTLLIRKPAILLVEHYWGYDRKSARPASLTVRPDQDEDVLNHLLEKVNRGGIESLSKLEKRRLEELSRRVK